MREYPDSLRDTNGFPVRFDCDCAECESDDDECTCDSLEFSVAVDCPIHGAQP